MSGREVIFETMCAGASKRIAAIDVATGVEVVIIAATHASERQAEGVALAKLMRALVREGVCAEQDFCAEQEAGGFGDASQPRIAKPGVWV